MRTGMWGSCPFDIDDKGTLTIRPGIGEDARKDLDWGGFPWDDFRDEIERVVFVREGDECVVAPERSNRMFEYCRFLESIDLSGLDATHVKSVRRLFFGCYSLVSVDLSGLDTSHVRDMSYLFKDCFALRTVGLSGLDTSRVEDMDKMFSGCPSIASLDLSGFDTSHAKNMSGMFDGCRLLKSVSVGDRFVFRDCELPEGEWRSLSTGEVYTAVNIATKRSGIADAYEKLGNAESVVCHVEECDFRECGFRSCPAYGCEMTTFRP